MSAAFLSHLSAELDGLKSAGLYKSERVISSTQSAEIEVGGRKVLNARRGRGRKKLSA